MLSFRFDAKLNIRLLNNINYLGLKNRKIAMKNNNLSLIFITI